MKGKVPDGPRVWVVSKPNQGRVNNAYAGCIARKNPTFLEKAGQGFVDLLFHRFPRQRTGVDTWRVAGTMAILSARGSGN